MKELLDAEIVFGFWESRWALREMLNAETGFGRVDGVEGSVGC